MSSLRTASSTEVGSLVEIPPGRYLIAGDSQEIFYSCDKPMLGIVVEDYRESPKNEMNEVLVDGKVVIYWPQIA